MVEDFVVGKTQDGPARGSQQRIAAAVGLSLAGSTMVRAVYFNDQRRFNRAEVDDNGAKRLLSAEFCPQLPTAQQLPQRSLCGGGRATKARAR